MLWPPQGCIDGPTTCSRHSRSGSLARIARQAEVYRYGTRFMATRRSKSTRSMALPCQKRDLVANLERVMAVKLVGVSRTGMPVHPVLTGWRSCLEQNHRSA